ncbi:hypothetical protein [Hyalangium rubrum]|uniref:Uncharacterized protein n=1 Tax=Hyalangium rubrum TaxID=3103134 RepID=A0ABU5H872_9BACT|nr:hypothetical protein [Hyalangium sp. s54d21]MDY7229515.1 hypothetical protein [Hyalangium sp. s54d21]
MDTTLTFNDAMARLSETLYTAAKVHVNTRRTGRLVAPQLHADASADVAFELKLDARGEVSSHVEKYCAGYTLRCTAWIESEDPMLRISGSIQSSDGGGIELQNVRPNQPVRFELPTSLWHSTRFTVQLKVPPAQAAGKSLRVKMRVSY